MSIVISRTSTYRSVGSIEKNWKIDKTSVSWATDSSDLSGDSSWSNNTGSANKPQKGNDPRWKAILAV
ncbi:hypothetical protein MKW92_019309 [Papaver armeniacum]|nr:hypothetical protein MKW92_019309 [Papaver armeniacum]